MEIIHESLLIAWPRLVRWQTQDADGARAGISSGRRRRPGRSGAGPRICCGRGRSYRDLAALERALSGRALDDGRRVRRSGDEPRGTEAQAAAVAVAAASRSCSESWASSPLSGDEPSSRSPAGKRRRFWPWDGSSSRTGPRRRSLTRSRASSAPTATRRGASPSRRSGTAARRSFSEDNMNTVDFSPDGKWLATGGAQHGSAALVHGGWASEDIWESRMEFPSFSSVPEAIFSPLVDKSGAILVDSRRKGAPQRRARRAARTSRRRGSHLLSVTETSDENEGGPRLERSAEETRTLLPAIDVRDVTVRDIDASGEWLFTGRGKGVYVSPFRDIEPDSRVSSGEHDGERRLDRVPPDRPSVRLGDETGEIRIWSVLGHVGRIWSARFERRPRAHSSIRRIPAWSSPSAEAHSTSEVAYIWDLNGPPDAEPFVLRNGDVTWLNSASIHPEGLWLAHRERRVRNSLAAPSQVFSRPSRSVPTLYRTSHSLLTGSELVSTSDDGTVRLWPLSAREGEAKPHSDGGQYSDARLTFHRRRSGGKVRSRRIAIRPVASSSCLSRAASRAQCRASPERAG